MLTSILSQQPGGNVFSAASTIHYQKHELQQTINIRIPKVKIFFLHSQDGEFELYHIYVFPEKMCTLESNIEWYIKLGNKFITVSL